MKRLYLILFSVIISAYGFSQAYIPIPLSGFTQDPVAESGTNSIAVTSLVVDGSNHIMYTNTFKTSNAMAGGGLPDNGTIVTGTRTFQLAPYTGNNALYVKRNEVRPLSVVTPAAYGKISILWFSTEGASLMNVSLGFSDGSSTTYLTNYNLPDWFGGTTNVALTGFGRVGRAATGPYVPDAYPTNPNFYYADITLNCADRVKLLQTVTFSNITTAGTNAPYPNAIPLAISGVAFQQTITTSSTPPSCSGSGGTATVNVSGSNGPFTYAWNTVPTQTTATATNLPAGTYTVTITDASACTTTQQFTLVAPNPPPAPTATGGTACIGGSVTLLVQNPVQGTTYNWYSLPSGGSILATGTGFTVSNVTTPAIYYVEAVTGACTSSTRGSATVNVLPALAIPVVTLTHATPSTLTFSWAAIPGATSYLVSTDGINYIIPSSGATGLTHTVTGLAVNQNVSLRVRAIGSVSCQVSPDGVGTGITLTNQIYIPNAFSPNHDGNNDVLLVYGNVISTMSMKIFDQWGELIFESGNQSVGWDGTYKGKQQPIGVYVYVFKAVLTDGTTYSKKGSINLIR